MKKLLSVLVITCSCLGGVVADTAFDFEKAWKEVRAAERKALPRTVTNLLAQISTEAIAAKRWPDAAQALMRIEGVEESLRDALLIVFL